MCSPIDDDSVAGLRDRAGIGTLDRLSVIGGLKHVDDLGRPVIGWRLQHDHVDEVVRVLRDVRRGDLGQAFERHHLHLVVDDLLPIAGGLLQIADVLSLDIVGDVRAVLADRTPAGTVLQGHHIVDDLIAGEVGRLRRRRGRR